ncbi:uncharacterized protein LOC115376640 isoform X2 [Myripristis murdjan]|uniref:uncharacterized protein LOC115376640 isoform X2 n=1 Tax=Myripristis murdjan TaxID=586833 RepID=UPI0011762A9C|nr:uncharacterized protein LOC115376640 isoform X2 [Myripristis murdjan]
MASLSAASLLALSSLICHLAASSAVLYQTAQPEDDVTLRCQAPDGVDIAAEWSRTDLKKESVFLYRDGRIDSEDQPLSFKNRVELKDGEIKNGNLSVILKNVTKNDSGTYECRITASDAKHSSRTIKAPPICTIRLMIVDPVPAPRQWSQLAIVLAVALALFAVAFVIYKILEPYRIKLNLNLKAHPGDDVTLRCQARCCVNIKAVEWSRPDLKEEKPVVIYRDGHIDSENLLLSFKNRVELKDKEMKNGDLSVILKNVKKEDSGTYEFRFKTAVAKCLTIISTDLISTIQLEVVDPVLNLNLTAHPGDDVTLRCQVPDAVNITMVKWSRTDLKEEEYVLLYQDGRIVTDHQPLTFKNRVDLKDKEMKNGDLSVILKNVKKEDSGTYECRYKASGDKADPICIIQLEVVDPEAAVPVLEVVAGVLSAAVTRRKQKPSAEHREVHSEVV